MKRARALRRTKSLPEVLLWQALRSRPEGLRFRRQFPLAPYTIDFACLSARLAIEVDGEQHGHGAAPARDAERDRFMASNGFSMMRIAAREVLKDLDAVVRAIVGRCAELGPLHHPRLRGDGPPPRSGEDL